MSSNLPNPRGYINYLEVTRGKLVVTGWMIHPQIEMDSFKAMVDGKLICEKPLQEVEGMGAAFPFLRHARRSVFNASVPYERKNGIFDIVIIGCKNGQEVAKLESWFAEELRPDFDFPDELKVRVANNSKKEFFSASSFTSFRNYFELVQQYADPGSIKNMLDWGCGCGRLTAMFARGTMIPGIYGCDIDGESIAWCKDNLKGNFDTIPLLPPHSV